MINNCVGRRNLKYFVIFVNLATFLALFGLVFTIIDLALIALDNNQKV